MNSEKGPLFPAGMLGVCGRHYVDVHVLSADVHVHGVDVHVHGRRED